MGLMGPMDGANVGHAPMAGSPSTKAAAARTGWRSSKVSSRRARMADRASWLWPARCARTCRCTRGDSQGFPPRLLTLDWQGSQARLVW